MGGLLSGGGAALFGEIFGGVFLPATIRTAMENTYDQGGTLRRGAEPRPCRIQVDRATQRWRDEPGFSANDVSVLILDSWRDEAGALVRLEGPVEPGNIVAPGAGPYTGQRFRLAAPIERDPAGAGWLARGVQERKAGG